MLRVATKISRTGFISTFTLIVIRLSRSFIWFLFATLCGLLTILCTPQVFLLHAEKERKGLFADFQPLTAGQKETNKQPFHYSASSPKANPIESPPVLTSSLCVTLSDFFRVLSSHHSSMKPPFHSMLVLYQCLAVCYHIHFFSCHYLVCNFHNSRVIDPRPHPPLSYFFLSKLLTLYTVESCVLILLIFRCYGDFYTSRLLVFIHRNVPPPPTQKKIILSWLNGIRIHR